MWYLRVTSIWPSIVHTIVYHIDCVVLTCSISPVSGPMYSMPLFTTLTVWYLRVPSALYLALCTLYHCSLHWLCGTYVFPVSGPLYSIPLFTTLTVWYAFHQPCIWPYLLYTIVHFIDCVVLTFAISPVSGPHSVTRSSIHCSQQKGRTDAARTGQAVTTESWAIAPRAATTVSPSAGRSCTPAPATSTTCTG